MTELEEQLQAQGLNFGGSAVGGPRRRPEGAPRYHPDGRWIDYEYEAKMAAGGPQVGDWSAFGILTQEFLDYLNLGYDVTGKYSTNTGPGGPTPPDPGTTNPPVPTDPFVSPGVTPGTPTGEVLDWDWDVFNPGAPSMEGGGGYDPADYAFDRYVPGQESPWGIPDIEGGNKDFYRNQFLNLLKDEQGFQQQQENAGLARINKIKNPLETVKADWSWIEGGRDALTAKASTGYGASGEEQQWLRPPNINIEAGKTTNMQIVNQMYAQGLLNDAQIDVFRNQWSGGPERDALGESTQWGGYQGGYDPAKNLGADLNTGARDAYSKALNNLWIQNNSMTAPEGGGPSTPAGYANPINWG